MNTYIALLHSHRLFVTLFFLIYLIKTILLLANPKALQKMRRNKFAKISEMVISAGFLLTGIAMLFQIAEIKTLLVVKIVLVAAIIPIGVIAFKKGNKLLGVITFLLIVGVYGLGEMLKRMPVVSHNNTQETNSSTPSIQAMNANEKVAYAKAIFNQHCVLCHGESGDLGLSGAANLKTSTLDKTGISNIIKKGKIPMPAYQTILSEDEITVLSDYVLSLKQQ